MTGSATTHRFGAAAAFPVALLGAALLAFPTVAAAQEGGGTEPEIRFGGLLRTGFRTGGSEAGRTQGFELHDARLRASGKIGIVFDWRVQAGWDPRRDAVELLDARLALPVAEAFRLEVGQFKAPFGKEALKGKGEIALVERSQASQLVAPGRQVGLQGTGEAFEGRFRYAAGLFNGNGRGLHNDDGSFLWAARAELNSVGAAEFYDEMVVEVGVNAAVSSDSAVDLGAELERPIDVDGLAFSDFRGDRVLLGADVRLGYRGFFLRGEYLRAELEPEPGILPAAAGRSAGVVLWPDEVTLSGGHLEAGYDLWGAVEALVRWDALRGPVREVAGHPAVPGDPTAGGTDFLIFGLQLFPGYSTKIGLQYAAGLDGTRVGPGLADGEFQAMAQVDF